MPNPLENDDQHVVPGDAEAQDEAGELENEQQNEAVPDQAQLQEDQEVSSDETSGEGLHRTLVTLGFVNFDRSMPDNATSNAMVSEEFRGRFRRDVYVGIHDQEQGIEFLGRVVEGPFHSPHEVGADSAITRTTVLYPDRTNFRATYYVEGSIEVLGQLTADGRLVPTATRPRPYSQIHVLQAERLRQLLSITGSFALGLLMGYDQVLVTTDAESKNFLPRNVGIFGTVGSGKSNTTQVIVEEALAEGWAVVIVDVEGEYVKMNEPTTDQVLTEILRSRYNTQPAGVGDFRVYVPQSGHSEATNPVRFKVPISAIDPWVLSDIMDLSEPQARMFESIALRARAARPASSPRQGALAPNQPERPSRAFTLQTLIDGLTDAAGGSSFPLVPNVRPTEVSTVHTLRSKLIRLGQSHMLDWNATAATSELPISELLVSGRLSVLDVSETDDRSRNLAIAYTLQALFDKVIEFAEGEPMENRVLRPKVLVVLEEIHTFVSRANVAKMQSVMDNLQVISRRGRKRWMALALVSQQPGHVPNELFELVNTRFIHQLKSAANLAPIKQTTGGVHEALWATLPSLGPGQCLVTSAVFKHPLFVEIRPARSRRLLTT